MSVILDALRKLDREKSSRKKTAANIAVEIVRPDSVHSARRVSVYLVTSVVAAIAAAAVTYGVMSEFGRLSKSSSPVSKTVPAPSQPVALGPPEPSVPSESSPPAAVSPPSATKQIPAPTAPVRNPREGMSHAASKVPSPAAKKDRLDVKIPVESKTPAESKTPVEAKTGVEAKTPVAPVVEKKENQSVVPKEFGTTPQRTAEPIPNTPATHPSLFKLSAIVWYEEPSRRFAMINGTMATEGSSVEGVKVVEINPTSVRLLYDGEHYEISMSK